MSIFLLITRKCSTQLGHTSLAQNLNDGLFIRSTPSFSCLVQSLGVAFGLLHVNCFAFASVCLEQCQKKLLEGSLGFAGNIFFQISLISVEISFTDPNNFS
eukprot:Gb_27903 [translate_table: standard]